MRMLKDNETTKPIIKSKISQQTQQKINLKIK